ncbi:metallophosphoesterase [Paenibacillus silviterrae]|uniref:metallophosphoesterase n=1 Tax=Paenibacillus silviterrae TaxID=3242194 RepID=UPI00254395FB|nr:metallophosphoesterase [Paenibacillus chinjuensis]
MNFRFLLVFTAIMVIYVGLNLYVLWNAVSFWETAFPSNGTGGLFWGVFVLLAFGYLLAMLLRRVLPYALYKWIKLIGAYGIACFFYCVLLLPFADLAVWLLQIAGYPGSSAVLVVGYIVMAILLVLLLQGTRNAWQPTVRRYDITIAKQAGHRKELRIAAASDLHLGTTVGKGHLSRLIQQMEALKPDMILLPGDVLDDSIEPFIRENMADVMRKLQAPLGVYACLGNHEYIGGHIEDYVKRMKEIGIEVLIDRVLEIDGSFYVAGRKDKSVNRFAGEGRLVHEELLKDIDSAKPIILLDHQPTQFAEAAQAGVDLMLSGHTHRGQMMPNHLITRRIFELDWGYLRKGAMHVIVSSGFGFWGPPVRIGSRSEILDIRVTFDS